MNVDQLWKRVTGSLPERFSLYDCECLIQGPWDTIYWCFVDLPSHHPLADLSWWNKKDTKHPLLGILFPNKWSVCLCIRVGSSHWIDRTSDTPFVSQPTTRASAKEQIKSFVQELASLDISYWKRALIEAANYLPSDLVRIVFEYLTRSWDCDWLKNRV